MERSVFAAVELGSAGAQGRVRGEGAGGEEVRHDPEPDVGGIDAGHVFDGDAVAGERRRRPSLKLKRPNGRIPPRPAAGPESEGGTRRMPGAPFVSTATHP